MTLDQIGALLVMIATWNQASEAALVMARHIRLAWRDGRASASKPFLAKPQRRLSVGRQRLTWGHFKEAASGNAAVPRRDKFFSPELDFVDWQRGMLWLQLAVGTTLLSIGTLDLSGPEFLVLLLVTFCCVVMTQASRHAYLAERRRRQAAADE